MQFRLLTMSYLRNVLLGIWCSWVLQVDSATKHFQPNSIRELAPTRAIPKEENAAEYLIDGVPRAEELWKRLEPVFMQTLESPLRKMTPEEQREATDLFARYADVLKRMERASQCKEVAWKIDFTQTPEKFLNSEQKRGTQLHLYSKIGQARIRWLVHENKAEEAVTHCLQHLQIARLRAHYLTIWGQAINIAMESTAISELGILLNQHRLMETTYQKIEETLSNYNRMDDVVHILTCERAVCLDLARSMPIKEVPFGGTHEEEMGRLFQSEIKVGNVLWHADANRKRPVMIGALAATVQPALKRLRIRSSQAEARVRSLRILNALWRRPQPLAEPPSRLGELKIPADKLLDPFSGQQLKIKGADKGKGWVVYSVGENGVDDNGSEQAARDIPVGLLY